MEPPSDNNPSPILNLDYADDVSLLAELLEDLVLQSSRFSRKKLGLEVNWQKAKGNLWDL